MIKTKIHKKKYGIGYICYQVAYWSHEFEAHDILDTRHTVHIVDEEEYLYTGHQATYRDGSS